jgi:hypothetical protein
LPGKAICRFQAGVVKNGSNEQIGITNTANECAALVLRKRPEADGVVWGEKKTLKKNHNTCWATFDTKGHRRLGPSWLGCLINGMIISL